MNNSDDNITSHFDVIIVGAGMVGSALACALGGSSLSVAVIEAQTLSDSWPEQGDSVMGFDTRVSALTVASQRFLQSLGVWCLITDHRVSPYRHMHVWDAEGTGSIDFSAQDINQPVLGHIVENRLTATGLLKKLNQHRNVHLIASAAVDGLQSLDSGGYKLLLQDGRQYQAPLIVAADGARSNIRTQADFTMREWAYNHHAIVATVKTEKPHKETAWQRFLPEGPLAFLPLQSDAGNQQYCSIVWSAIPQYAENLMAQDDQLFADSLAAAFEYQLGDVLATSQRFSFPLGQRHAVDYCKPGLALVGDAAHTIHPLAGQGVNLGLMDVQVLSEELLRAEQRQLDVGSMAVLARYQRRRKAANLGMMASMEGFKRLFAQNALPVRWARNTGMRWLDKMTPLKHRVMRQAMGL